MSFDFVIFVQSLAIFSLSAHGVSENEFSLTAVCDKTTLDISRSENGVAHEPYFSQCIQAVSAVLYKTTTEQ